MRRTPYLSTFGFRKEGVCSGYQRRLKVIGQPKGPSLGEEDLYLSVDVDRQQALARANEILRKASAFFAQAELDRRPK